MQTGVSRMTRLARNDIGEKIRRIRRSRNMTQSELAGDQITRNMLSRIENGVALPSLPTVWYLAERLGVPAGFLLAEGDDDRVWRKISRIDGIRRVLASGDARICLDLCRGDGGEEPDDEITLIMAQCCLKIAAEEFELGHLHETCKLLDEALEYAGKTPYNTEGIRMTAILYFRFLHRISALLYSEVLTDAQTQDGMVGSCEPFGCYVLAREALDAGDIRRVQMMLERQEWRDNEWMQHLRAQERLLAGDYIAAQEVLTKLLNSRQAMGEVLVYVTFADLEVCCRELGDFRGAYEYAQDKVTLLERMLQK